MATITRRKDSSGNTRWLCRIRRIGNQQISKTFDTKTDAQKWATLVERELHLGNSIPDAAAQRRTVAQAIDRWLDEKLPDCAESDRKNTKQMLEWWRGEIGQIALLRLTPERIHEALESLRGERTDSRVNRYHTALSRVLGRSVKLWRWLPSNPCASVPKLPEPPGRTRFLTDDEKPRLWDFVAGREDAGFHLFVSIALSTGARRGEIANLEWRDIDLTGKRATLRDTKNGTHRTVPLTDAVVEAAKSLRSALPAIPLDGKLKVFPHSYWHDWRQVQKHFTDFRFHDTRHTAASYAAMAGASPLEIGSLLGQKTLAMVRRYSHLSDQHTRTLVEKVAARSLPAQGAVTQ